MPSFGLVFPEIAFDISVTFIIRELKQKLEKRIEFCGTKGQVREWNGKGKNRESGKNVPTFLEHVQFIFLKL